MMCLALQYTARGEYFNLMRGTNKIHYEEVHDINPSPRDLIKVADICIFVRHVAPMKK
jgi:hypothetical protein